MLSLLFAAVPLADAFGSLCGSETFINGNVSLAGAVPEPNTRVIFMGDQGVRSTSTSVLRQMKAFNPAFIMHSGDFDYVNSPSQWEAQLDSELGPDYPYFATIGNHDVSSWTTYQSNLVARLRRFGGDKFCNGDYGVNMVCNYKGILFVLSGVGTRGSGHVDYLNSAFAATPAVWKFVSWHKNQRLMQVGGKSDEVGWPIYEATLANGAIVATGHEHSYSRTYNMLSFQRQTVASQDAVMTIKPGQSFAFVSGLGGESIRSYSSNLQNNPWWAATAASNDGVRDGALYCTFNVDGDPRKATCDQIDTAGRKWDTFTIKSENSESTPSLMTTPLSTFGEWIEVPVASSVDDMHNGDCLVKEHAFTTSGDGAHSMLRFARVPITKDDISRIEHVYLQVYGAPSKNTKGDVNVTMRAVVGHSPPLPCKAGEYNLPIGNSTVAWTVEPDDFEVGEVWISPDIKDLLIEAIQAPTWEKHSAFTLLLDQASEGNDKLLRKFKGFDASKCMTPHIAIEFYPPVDAAHTDL